MTLNLPLSCDLAANPAARLLDPDPLLVPPDWTLDQVARAMSGDRRGAKGLGMQVGVAQGQRATGPTAGLEGAKDSEGLEGLEGAKDSEDSEGSDPAPPIATHRYSYALVIDGRQIQGILTERIWLGYWRRGLIPR